MIIIMQISNIREKHEKNTDLAPQKYTADVITLAYLIS